MTALSVIQRLNVKRISPAKAGVLLHLAKGPAKMIDIELGAGLTQGTVSTAIQTLINVGAVERAGEECYEDSNGRMRICVLFKLTEDGEQEVRGILR